MSISNEMPDWFRRALHPTLPLAVIASLWVLASAQRPLEHIALGTWVDSTGVTVVGNPYDRAPAGLRLIYHDDDDASANAVDEPGDQDKSRQAGKIDSYVNLTLDVEE